MAAGRGFDYEIPAELRGRILPGSRVTAPLRGHAKSGYVLRLKKVSEFPQLERIQALEDPERQIPAPLLKLGEWISANPANMMTEVFSLPIISENTGPNTDSRLKISAAWDGCV